MFDWRQFGPERFDEHPAVIAARSQAKAGIIPDACSGAAFSYIAEQLAPSMKEKPRTYIQRGFICASEQCAWYPESRQGLSET